MTIDFIERLKHRLGQPLPGALAQDQMKARRSTGEAITFRHKGPPRKGGVAILLYQDKGSWYFPLMKRKEYPGVHSGQISLPGGKMESEDSNLTQTALRESREELGLKIPQERVVGKLSDLYIIASHFNIVPVVASLPSEPSFIPDEREVDQVFLASVERLLDQGRQEKDLMVRGFDIRAPYFEVDNQVVWGATAMIINEFLTLVREIRG
jgi:8-oxo-dGTP pyrophosphatase MutT (NUDIX family)